MATTAERGRRRNSGTHISACSAKIVYLEEEKWRGKNVCLLLFSLGLICKRQARALLPPFLFSFRAWASSLCLLRLRRSHSLSSAVLAPRGRERRRRRRSHTLSSGRKLFSSSSLLFMEKERNLPPPPSFSVSLVKMSMNASPPPPPFL